MFTKIARLDLRFLSLVQVKNCPFQFSKFSFSYGKVEILCGNLALLYIYIYLPSRTINLSLLVEKRINHLVEDIAFNLIDMFREKFFDKIFVHFFFWQSLVSTTNVYTIILSTGWWIGNIWAIWHSRIVRINIKLIIVFVKRVL